MYRPRSEDHWARGQENYRNFSMVFLLFFYSKYINNLYMVKVSKKACSFFFFFLRILKQQTIINTGNTNSMQKLVHFGSGRGGRISEPKQKKHLNPVKHTFEEVVRWSSSKVQPLKNLNELERHLHNCFQKPRITIYHFFLLSPRWSFLRLGYLLSSLSNCKLSFKPGKLVTQSSPVTK